MKRIVFVGIPLLITLSFTQAPDTLWTKKYGDVYSDGGESVKQTSDKGYIIAGWTQLLSSGMTDVWLLKTDSLGDTLWTKTYGGERWDFGHAVQVTEDGGYAIVGNTEHNSGFTEVYFIKTDSLGDTLWTKTYGGWGQAFGYSFQQTSDGGYIIAGKRDTLEVPPETSYVYVIKTDSLGDILWQKTYGGANYDCGYSIQQTLDGGYIILAGTCPSTSYDIIFLKVDSIGDTLWAKTWDGGGDDRCGTTQQTLDEGYIIIGSTNSFGAGSYDIWLIKTDSLGDTLWTRTYGTPEYEQGNWVQQTLDGGYIIVGHNRRLSKCSVFLVKTDSIGDTLWTKTIIGEDDDYGRAGQQTSDGGYIIVGYSQNTGGWYDVYLIRIAPDVGVGEGSKTSIAGNQFGATILSGPLLLPEGKNYKIFDITGRIVVPNRIKPGIYFIEIEGKITRKVVKIR